MTDSSDSPGDAHVYERAIGESPVEAIVLAVSQAIDRSPVEMPPVATVISPDAVNRILGSESETPSSVRISFEYCGRKVSATGSRVRVADPA